LQVQTGRAAAIRFLKVSPESSKVVVARALLPEGERLLAERFTVSSGGLDAGRRELLDLVPGAAAIVADPTVGIDRVVLEAAGPSLRLVANFAVGYDNVDLGECARRGVVVTNTPDVLTDATAELALGLTLAAARQTPQAEKTLRDGGWTGWDPGAFHGSELSGASFGIVGMGRIGLRYSQLVSPMAGEILYFSRSRSDFAERSLDARRVSLEVLLGEADVISLHLPAGSGGHLIGADEIALMKQDAVLVNTARGALVDSEALARALFSGSIGSAALDVFENEPAVPAALLEAPRLVLTPHIGSATARARGRMAELAARNVIAVLSGEQPLTEVRATPDGRADPRK
jgi:glyoxylate reductase